MQLYIDSADVGEIEQAAALGCVEGVTLNPKLIGSRQRAPLVREICPRVPGFVCVPARGESDAGASVRSAQQVEQSARIGAPACTMSLAVLESLVEHPLTSDLHAEYRAGWLRS